MTAPGRAWTWPCLPSVRSGSNCHVRAPRRIIATRRPPGPAAATPAGRHESPSDRPGLRRARRATEWGRNKYAGSWAEYLWHRLDAVDFMNQAMLLAATLLLCAVPFMLIAAALAGRSAVSALTVRLGLSPELRRRVARKWGLTCKGAVELSVDVARRPRAG
jgi:hypothetical protein